ncbi:Cadherin-1 [Oryzias melastigma]|uniref:Cadherin-1 n=1 Tax=Oryzias melastigma TaxID=30732 RepID=A0A834C179_ORYME|nr:Cadherin-1 [Oryzias melastigma]
MDITRGNNIPILQEHPDVAVLYFPKSSKGLRRRKRDWVIPPINHPENQNGPFPFKMVQVRSSEDKIKKITYSITGPGADEDPKGLFTMDKDTGDLYVHQRLDREKQAKYTLMAHASAEDPMEIIINGLQYKIIDDPEGWLKVDEDTGLVKVKTLMDRESIRVTDNKYTALIGAYDNDPVPATGTGTLIIKLEDVNDNAPVIEERKATVCRKARIPTLLTVLDKDEAAHSSPYNVAVHEKFQANWTAQMNKTRTGIELTLKKSDIPAGIYKVVLRVADRDNLEQDSSINVEVCDCAENGVCLGSRKGVEEAMPSYIWGILGAVLLLLVIAILGLYVYKRHQGQQKEDEKDKLIKDELMRDSVFHYAEEGGGEDDQDFDLSVLHYGLDNKPDVLRSDIMPSTMSRPTYRTLPANPDEIGNFIDDNLKAADEDPTAAPYDSLLVFDYEGGGSDAGSLSSGNSSNSGDQDYNCLNEWGPRFKKLAYMYGGGEDDDDML